MGRTSHRIKDYKRKYEIILESVSKTTTTLAKVECSSSRQIEWNCFERVIGWYNSVIGIDYHRITRLSGLERYTSFVCLITIETMISRSAAEIRLDLDLCMS